MHGGTGTGQEITHRESLTLPSVATSIIETDATASLSDMLGAAPAGSEFGFDGSHGPWLLTRSGTFTYKAAMKNVALSASATVAVVERPFGFMIRKFNKFADIDFGSDSDVLGKEAYVVLGLPGTFLLFEFGSPDECAQRRTTRIRGGSPDLRTPTIGTEHTHVLHTRKHLHR